MGFGIELRARMFKKNSNIRKTGTTIAQNTPEEHSSRNFAPGTFKINLYQKGNLSLSILPNFCSLMPIYALNNLNY